MTATDDRPARDAESADVVTVDVVVVGAGFNGLYQLKRLRDAGWSVRVVEAGDGLGGVWHHNRYPGARVDSHIPNYEFTSPEIWRDWNWSERFPGRDELVRYFEHIDRVWDLSRDVDLGCRITTAHSTGDGWRLESQDGRRYECRWLIMCTGFGSAPYVPDLPGLESFEGECQHTAAWPDELDLAGRRVGVIGTGASAVQVIQEAAPVASRLTVFQRTPVYALPMQQRELTVEEQTEAKAGYAEMFARRNEPPTSSFHDIAADPRSALEVTEGERLANYEDRWAKGGFHFWAGTFADTLSDEGSNRLAYEFWRDKVRSRLADPALHEVLAPTEPPYPFGTKRPSLETTYYDLFDRPTVDLVDLRSDPLVEITPDGVRTASAEVELDVLVLATGFDANTGGFTRMDFRGVGGRHIADVWADGVDTHTGVAVPGFPNMLILYGPQSAASFCNGPVCAELQGDWVVDLLDHARRHGHTRFDTSDEHARQWTETLADYADGTLFGRADSWYMGANIPGKRRQLLNVPSADGYLTALRTCAAEGYSGFEFS